MLRQRLLDLKYYRIYPRNDVVERAAIPKSDGKPKRVCSCPCFAKVAAYFSSKQLRFTFVSVSHCGPPESLHTEIDKLMSSHALVL